jgi:hypothetical protein
MPQASPVPRAAARPDYCDNAIGRYIGVVLVLLRHSFCTTPF